MLQVYRFEFQSFYSASNPPRQQPKLDLSQPSPEFIGPPGPGNGRGPTCLPPRIPQEPKALREGKFAAPSVHFWSAHTPSWQRSPPSPKDPQARKKKHAYQAPFRVAALLDQFDGNKWQQAEGLRGQGLSIAGQQNDLVENGENAVRSLYLRHATGGGRDGAQGGPLSGWAGRHGWRRHHSRRCRPRA